jgi:hypothetical protein
MSNGNGKCKTPGCQDVVRYNRLSLCHACYSWYKKWAQRSPLDFAVRRDQITRLGRRCGTLESETYKVRNSMKYGRKVTHLVIG